MFFVRLLRRNAATEVSVLIDVLNVAREKHYMVFDPVQQQDANETKPMAVIYARKKVLILIPMFHYMFYDVFNHIGG